MLYNKKPRQYVKGIMEGSGEMGKTAGMRAFYKHYSQKEVDTKIREGRDDLLRIMQSEHKMLNQKIDVLDIKIEALEVKLETKIDALEVKLETKIDALEVKLETKIDALEGRMDGIEKRIDGIDKRMDGFDKRMDGFDKRMDKMEKHMGVLTFQIVSMKKWAIGLFMAFLFALLALAAPFYMYVFL